MANIKLIRIDSRLIHGQVVTKWVKVANANRIVIIDDELSQDSFMGEIYKMAAPNGVEVEIFSVEAAVENWNENQLGVGEVLLLFKNVENCYRIFTKNFPIKELQIGGLASGPGRTTVFRAVSFDREDVEQLKEMNSAGIKIILQIIPEEQKVMFEKVISKHKF